MCQRGIQSIGCVAHSLKKRKKLRKGEIKKRRNLVVAAVNVLLAGL